ncbi:MAG: EamA family transporter [Actinomycetes bacterium]
MTALAGPALALLSSVLWGSADFGGGLLSRRLHPAAVVGASQAVGLLAVLLVAVVSGAVTGPLGWLPWAVAAGLAGTVGLVSFYAALASGTMGVVSPIAALGAVVPVLIGLLSGERPSALQVAGIAVALVGAVAASGPELRGAAGARPVLLAAVAGVGFGLALVFIGGGSQTSAIMTLAGMRGVSVSLFLLAALALRTTGGVRPRDALPLALVGLGDAGANLAFGVASTLGLLSVTAVLGSLYPVVTVLLARGVLHERLRRVQQVGVAAALGGVVLIAAG